MALTGMAVGRAGFPGAALLHPAANSQLAGQASDVCEVHTPTLLRARDMLLGTGSSWKTVASVDAFVLTAAGSLAPMRGDDVSRSCCWLSMDFSTQSNTSS